MPLPRSAPPTPSKPRRRALAIRAAAVLAAGFGPAWLAAVSAQELSLLAGPLGGEHERSYTWEAEFRQGLGRYAAWSFSWLNEGHIPDHHRDGPLLQAWARLPLLDNRLELSAGAGPYWFFDTVAAEAGGSYSNTHGWGGVVSVRAAYYFANRWVAQLKLNRVESSSGPGTTGILFGVGYQLDAPDQPGPRESAPPRSGDVTGNELTLMYGKAILNSTVSETATAGALEYRRGIARAVDVTATYLHEAGDLHSRRDGIAAQLWLTGGYFGDRLTLSAGAGPYVAITQNDDQTGDGRLSGLFSVSASYRFTTRWLARVTWNRVATRYDRDVDLILAGVGVKF
jgi:hypothetical protein